MTLAVYNAIRDGYNMPFSAILVDSVTGCAFGLIFETLERDADRSIILDANQHACAFLRFAQNNGVANGDVRALPTNKTITLQEAFFALPIDVRLELFHAYLKDTHR